MAPPPAPGYRYSTYPTSNTGFAPQQSQYQSQSSQQQQHISAAKTRQYAHLHSQLAQLNANLADTENLVRMTAVQAGDLRFLGGYMGALFMGATKVLGEEGVASATEDKSGNDSEGNRNRVGQRNQDVYLKDEDEEML
ncbi:hypothetical protein AAP_03745 [Ascosphaera apis ARSEF 7405]|uniref:DASH complex subunit Hsk3 like-domain-containing protein n=1 Tax=Ascosphaera apis ARSEF 7405 TaxID=392613 RepID=A0A166NKQ7_9EURO|nr:hypothetical protein AAP_03745 [Ascosphaera apis ARSEF 7405]